MAKCNPLKISEMEGVNCLLPEDLIPLVHKGTNRAITIAQLVQLILGLAGNDPDMLKIACEAKSMALQAVSDAEQALQKSCDALSIADKLQSMVTNIDTRLANAEQDIYTLKQLANQFAELSRQLTYLSQEVEALKNQSLEIRGTEQNDFLTYILYRDNVAIGSPILVPTKLSQLKNDTGFITADDIPTVPTKVSELENDENFVKESALKGIEFVGGKFDPVIYSPLNASLAVVKVPTKTSELDNDSNFLTEVEKGSLGELTDVTLTSAGNGDILYHNGTNWINTGLTALIQPIVESIINNTVPNMIEAAQLWSRSNSTLSPKNSGDNIDTTGAIYSGSETWQEELS